MANYSGWISYTFCACHATVFRAIFTSNSNIPKSRPAATSDFHCLSAPVLDVVSELPGLNMRSDRHVDGLEHLFAATCDNHGEERVLVCRMDHELTPNPAITFFERLVVRDMARATEIFNQQA